MAEETWQTTVEVGEAHRVRATIGLSSGKIAISDGGEALLDGTFTYAAPLWKPDLSYEVQSDIGHLVVRAPEVAIPSPPNARYDWDLALGGGIPIDLGVKLGSGSAGVRLAETQLTALAAQAASGQVAVELDDQSVLQDISLKSGSGRLDLTLRGDCPQLAEVEMKNASGMTVLALEGNYPSLERVVLSNASGQVDVALPGTFPQLRQVEARVASGVLNFDLADIACTILDLNLDCVSGEVVIRYPASIGVALRFSSVTGQLRAPGLHRDDDGRLVTSNYETAACKVNVKMSTVSGKLTLQPTAD